MAGWWYRLGDRRHPEPDSGEKRAEHALGVRGPTARSGDRALRPAGREVPHGDHPRRAHPSCARKVRVGIVLAPTWPCGRGVRRGTTSRCSHPSRARRGCCMPAGPALSVRSRRSPAGSTQTPAVGERLSGLKTAQVEGWRELPFEGHREQVRHGRLTVQQVPATLSAPATPVNVGR